jgi:phosphoglycolate phosphatase
MPYQLIIFDLDGTLSNSFSWFLRAAPAVADKHGFKRIDDVEALRGKDIPGILEALAVPRHRLPFIARDLRRLKTQSLDEIALFPGVPEMLATLAARGVTLALVSSDLEANARRALGPLTSHISHFACGVSLFGKARRFKSVMRAAGVAPAATLAIGDEQRDADAATAAGIAFAAVAWGYATPEALAKTQPVTVFKEVREIAEWVR